MFLKVTVLKDIYLRSFGTWSGPTLPGLRQETLSQASACEACVLSLKRQPKGEDTWLVISLY